MLRRTEMVPIFLGRAVNHFTPRQRNLTRATAENIRASETTLTMAYPEFHFGSNLTQIIYIYPAMNLSHLLSCPFEIECMAILGYKSIYTPLGTPLKINALKLIHGRLLTYGD